MELKYKMYFERKKNYQEAIRILVENELYSSAYQLLWANTRNSIFYFLERKNITFDSSQEAIVNFILLQDSQEMRKSIYEVYTNSIINEWDFYTSINKSQYRNFEEGCLSIQKIATNG